MSQQRQPPTWSTRRTSRSASRRSSGWTSRPCRRPDRRRHRRRPGADLRRSRSGRLLRRAVLGPALPALQAVQEESTKVLPGIG